MVKYLANSYVLVNFCSTYVAITMEFNQSVYSVDEDGGSLQLMLVLSNPSSFIITANVISTSESATGE